MALLTETWNTASVGAASSLNSNLVIPGGINDIWIQKIEITPSASGGLSSYLVYNNDTFAGDILYEATANALSPFYDPVKIDEDGNMSNEAEGGLLYYVDKDASGEFHIKIFNQAAVGRTYSVQIWYINLATDPPQAHKDLHDPADGSDPLDTAAGAEISAVVAAGAGTSHSFARADHIHAINHAITDNHIVTIDGIPNAAEWGIWTANGMDGKTHAEARTLLNVADGAIANIIEDTTPQLGGNLDTNSKNINAINQTNAIENESKLLQTEDIFSDFVVTGLLPATSATLISNISAGHAYVTGTRVNKAATSHTYTASVDTYVDINSAGVYTFPEVALSAAAPAVTADSIRLAKVVTNATAITGVTDLRELTLTLPAPTVTLTGGQLAFPATAVPSADPNTLDDYEEGTWTPVVNGTTLTAEIGKYTKIARVVFMSFCDQDGIAALAVDAACVMTGFPFAIGSYTNGPYLLAYSDATDSYEPQPLVAKSGNNNIEISNRSASATTTSDGWNFSGFYTI